MAWLCSYLAEVMLKVDKITLLFLVLFLSLLSVFCRRCYCCLQAVKSCQITDKSNISKWKTVLQHNFTHLDYSFTSVLVQFLLLFQLQVPLLSFVSWKIWNHKPSVRGGWKQEVSNTLLSLLIWWSHLLTSVKVALNFSCHDLCSSSFSCRRDATCCCAVESWFCKVITSSPEGLWRKWRERHTGMVVLHLKINSRNKSNGDIQKFKERKFTVSDPRDSWTESKTVRQLVRQINRQADS